MRVQSFIIVFLVLLLTGCAEFFSTSWVEDNYDEDCQGCCSTCENPCQSAQLRNVPLHSNLRTMAITCPLRYHCKDIIYNDGSVSFDSYRLKNCVRRPNVCVVPRVCCGRPYAFQKIHQMIYKT